MIRLPILKRRKPSCKAYLMRSALKSAGLFQSILKYRPEILILIIFHPAAAAADQAEAAAAKFPDETLFSLVFFIEVLVT